jgi:hypothetical protein
MRADGRSRDRRAVDLEPGVAPGTVARAVRGEAVEALPDGVLETVEAATPGPAHEYVGTIDGSDDPPLRAALAAAARSVGRTAPQDEAIAECEARLEEIAPPAVDVESARRRVAEAGERESRLQERVAQLRGRVQTLREFDRTAALEEAESELAAATAELTEVRTERIAAEQSLDRATSRARAARDVRERRLGLEDRLGNLRRRARAHLASDVYGEFAAALEAVPGEGSPGDVPGEYEGDGTTAALAVARVAALRAPVVVACGRFPAADAAAATLDAPVIRVQQQ